MTMRPVPELKARIRGPTDFATQAPLYIHIQMTKVTNSDEGNSGELWPHYYYKEL